MATKRRVKKKKGKALGWLLVLLAIGLAVGAYFVIQRYSDAQKNEQMLAALNRTTFFDGIYVNDIPIGGMSYDQAEKTISQSLSGNEGSFSLRVEYEGSSWTVDQSSLKFAYNTKEILDEAYLIGRRSASVLVNYEEITALEQAPKHYTVTHSVEAQDLDALLNEIADAIDVDARDATVEAFSPSTGFQFVSEKAGRKADISALRAEIQQRVKDENFASPVVVKVTVVEPTVTVQQLQASYKLLSEYHSETTKDSKRNSNIKLALASINGTVVEAGATISFNETTGQRTADKGYQDAGVIKNGVLIPEVGGGVCQVSTALFNAVAIADLTITERNPHSWPSSYVDIGMDAMVDYPHSDFKFTNNTQGSLYLVAYYNDDTRTITIQVYGMSRLEEGVTIKLRSETTETIPQPDDQMQESDLLEVGVIQETRTGRKGYRANTYKQYYKDGQMIKEELLFQSYYRPIAAILTVGTAQPQTPVVDPGDGVAG